MARRSGACAHQREREQRAGPLTGKALDSMTEAWRRSRRSAEKRITLIVERSTRAFDHPDYFLGDPATCVDV